MGNEDTTRFEMIAIGTVRNARADAIDDDWDHVDSVIQLDLDVLEPDATDGLRSFSHVEVVYVFDRVGDDDIVHGARHPRGNPDWPSVGILAQRAKHRPNRIGTTVCELMAVRPGGIVEVRGLDAIDGTPVLDIKPYMAEFGPRGDVLQPRWSHDLMAQYWTLTSRPAATEHQVVQPEQWLAEVLQSPADQGRLDLIVRRPATGEREVLTIGELDARVGLIGDNWLDRGSRNSPDGAAEPDAQLNIMNTRCARLVAGSDDRIPLAGDQLFVDLDLSPDNLPPGTRLQIGTAIIEVTAKPHTGCAKFTRRFGLAAHRWINGTTGKQHRLRGICAQVVVPGTIAQGDTISKLPAAGTVRTVDSVDSVDSLLAFVAEGAGVYDGDPVDLLDHALQCAHELRLRYPDDEELQLAGLLHDIGHQLVPGDDAGHGIAAAAAIRPLLGPRVAMLVEHHVPAKRYLVATDPSYFALLTPTSVRTLGNQGGTMAPDELAAFEALPYWTDGLQVRWADDAAKTVGREVPDLSTWAPVLVRVAAAHAGRASA